MASSKKREFTPTDEQVRLSYIEYPYVAEIKDEPADGAEFDRWLSKKVQAAFDRGYMAADDDRRRAGDGRGMV